MQKKIQTNDLERATAWLAYIDIYGFGVELTEKLLTSLSERLNALHDAINRIISKKTDCHLYMLSDSIVLFCTHNDNGRTKALTDLINVVIEVQTVAVGLDFVFRGILAHGPLVFGGRVCLGPSLLKAVRLEAQLGIPLVVVPEAELDRKTDVFVFETNGPRMIPTKNGFMLGSPLVPVPMDRFRDHVTRKLYESAKSGPDYVAKVWAALAVFLSELAQNE